MPTAAQRAEARVWFDLAIQASNTVRHDPTLGHLRTIIQQMAAGLKELARTPEARQSLTAAIQTAFAGRLNPDVELLRSVLEQTIAGLRADIA